eukprot:357218-Chlamydomonas_euryale.AAC.40
MSSQYYSTSYSTIQQEAWSIQNRQVAVKSNAVLRRLLMSLFQLMLRLQRLHQVQWLRNPSSPTVSTGHRHMCGWWPAHQGLVETIKALTEATSAPAGHPPSHLPAHAWVLKRAGMQ